MGQLRPAFGQAVAETSAILANDPDAARFDHIVSAAERMAGLGRFLAELPPDEHENHHDIERVAGHDLSDVNRLGQALSEQAARLAQAARHRDVSATTEALGAVATACATCHEAARW
jgi:hypothetical protein